MNIQHRGILFLLVLIASLSVPQEAFVSQVHVHEIPHNWEHSLERAPVIVVARRSSSPQLYRQWVFPRETHYAQAEETVAREWVQHYEILEVIRPAAERSLGPGQEIRVWRQPEYGPGDLEHYHRTGEIHSPIILVKEAVVEILDGRVLLFLEPHQDVWRYFDDSPEEGESLLDRRATEFQEP